MPPLGKDDASGSAWMSWPPVKLSMGKPSLIERKASCFSAVAPVSGWNQCVKWVAPCSIAQSFMAPATASARPVSRGRPDRMVAWMASYTGRGSRFCIVSRLNV